MTLKFHHPFPAIILLLILSALMYSQRSTMLSPISLGNLHTHTTCSDGKNSYDDMITGALKLNFKFIAITDHHRCPDVISKCLTETRLLCLPGQEVTSTRTHLLALNVASAINPDLPLIKQVETIHRLGGLAIAAHPNSPEYLYTDAELTQSNLDAMECTRNLQERRPLPCVFDSDAHKVTDLSAQFSSCPASIHTIDALKSAITSSQCTRSFSFPIPNTKNSQSSSLFLL